MVVFLEIDSMKLSNDILQTISFDLFHYSLRIFFLFFQDLCLRGAVATLFLRFVLLREDTRFRRDFFGRLLDLVTPPSNNLPRLIGDNEYISF